MKILIAVIAFLVTGCTVYIDESTIARAGAECLSRGGVQKLQVHDSTSISDILAIAYCADGSRIKIKQIYVWDDK